MINLEWTLFAGQPRWPAAPRCQKYIRLAEIDDGSGSHCRVVGYVFFMKNFLKVEASSLNRENSFDDVVWHLHRFKKNELRTAMRWCRTMARLL